MFYSAFRAEILQKTRGTSKCKTLPKRNDNVIDGRIVLSLLLEGY